MSETDCDFLHRVLSDGQWHSLGEILRRSALERGHGLTVHSRASDLRTKRGLVVDQENVPGAGRGEDSRYRLLGEDDVQVGEVAVDPGLLPVRRSTVPTMPASSSPSSPVTTTGEAGEPTTGAAPDTHGQMTLTGGSFTKQRRAA